MNPRVDRRDKYVPLESLTVVLRPWVRFPAPQTSVFFSVHDPPSATGTAPWEEFTAAAQDNLLHVSRLGKAQDVS